MKIDSHLEERANLIFHFYTNDHHVVKGGSGSAFRHSTMKLDFAENVKIQEQQQSRVATYSAIGRNGNSFLHLGSDSRTFNLSFNITLPHIMQNTTVKALGPRENYEKKKQQREQYLNGGEEAPKFEGTSYTDYIRLVDNMFRGYLDEQEKFADILKVLGSNAAGFLGAPGFEDDSRTEAIAKCLKWLNLIRSCTLTFAPKPHYGPPLIRLNHGIVYQNVPCIATNYSIDVDGAAGYDNRTLLPRVIKVTMKLQEVRVSSVQNEFNPVGSTPREYDSDVGWEMLQRDFVSYNRIDDSSIQVEEEETP